MSSSSTIGCYYKILGVKKDATVDEIKSSFRQLCLKYHPDVVSSTSSSTTNNNTAEMFKRITVAAGVLTNPKKRMKYDTSVRYGNPYDDDDDGRRRQPYDSSSPYAYSSSSSSAFHDYAWARRTERRQNQQKQQQRRNNPRNFYAHGGGFHQRLRFMFHPIIFFFVGPVLIYTTATTIRFIANKVDDSNTNNDTTTSGSTGTDDTKRSILFTHKQNGNDDLVQAWKNPITNQYETPAPWDPVYRNSKPELVLVPRGFVKARPR